jgi:hypothetical protein
MQFSEMTQWIIETTKRADKITDIKNAINAAIENFSLSANFAKDLVEFTHTFVDNTTYVQALSLSSVFTRYRSMKYLRQTGRYEYIKWTDPQNIFDGSCEQLNTWYQSGNNIILKRSVLVATLEVGYYQYPTRLSLSTDTHWMMDVIPTTIHDKAAARVFYVIGENADADKFEKMARDDFQEKKERLEDGATTRS